MCGTSNTKRAAEKYGILILSITWILTSLVWFFVIGNTPAGIIWLCGGIVELIIALIRCNKEKKS